ncbi:zinc finger protein 639-like [Narcine bancroftii]|uniref:zinc finger protein 639-like n=1 Tax=Narcine bancroftii TaxID=1343680 RepID=UPI003831F34E
MSEHGKRKRRKSLNPSRYSGSDSTVEDEGESSPEHWTNSNDSQDLYMTVRPVNAVLKTTNKRQCGIENWSLFHDQDVKFNTYHPEQNISFSNRHQDDATESSVSDGSERQVKSPCMGILYQHKWPLRKPSCDGLYSCERCDFNTKYPLELKQHVILRHTDTLTNICPVCKREFLTCTLLHKHLQAHETEDPSACQLCTHSAENPKELGLHVADAHISESLYWCEQCDIHFCSTSDLHLHLQQHDGDEEYLCQFCEYGTDDAAELHAHVLAEHAYSLMEMNDTSEDGLHGSAGFLSKVSFDRERNFFVCQSCGYRSRLYANVNRHVAIEHARFFPYVCDDCGKGFCNTAEYDKHLNLHTSQEIYLCQYCDYSTEQITNLHAHIDMGHTAALPYKCEMCMLRFARNSELMWHLAKHKQNNELLWYQVYDN